MHVQDVRLDDVLIALSVARVVARVDEAHAVDVERAVREHLELVLGELRQVEPVPAPDDRRRRRSRHVALDLDVVAHARRDLVHLERFVQRDHGHTCRAERVSQSSPWQRRSSSLAIDRDAYWLRAAGVATN